MIAWPAALLAIAAPAGEPPVVVVKSDDTEITQSCTVRVEAPWIADAAGDGVIRITAPGITVDFAGASLAGASGGDADIFSGIGVRITARGVTLRGARISGFRTGVLAERADDLVIESCDLSGNFRQRLGSTAGKEDPQDWLWPHANDGGEWLRNYGAALCVKESRNVTLRGVTVRRGQNGIVLDRVEGSEICGNDCSYLSGWGLALWRSSGNVIAGNAFVFCVRGYSHGVYNRGQDSAGILLFEQCSDNVIAANSATHCGDGLFCFAGTEALGQANPRDDQGWYAGRGCNRNLIAGNDFSWSAAHGVEITFSFGNRLIGNRIAGNAICGLWGGYSQDTYIAGNTFSGNGDMPYGAERGGINIEHGRGNRIEHNRFERNACGVRLWWDEDASLLATPWCRANERGSTGNVVAGNVFFGDRVGIELRRTADTAIGGNECVEVVTCLDADEESLAGKRDAVVAPSHLAPPDVHGGRELIVIDEWGPSESGRVVDQ